MKIKKVVLDLMREESGQDLIEYALVSGLIAVGAIATMKTLAGTISGVFTTIGGKLVIP